MRSTEVSCNDKHLRACLDAEVDPKLLLSGEDISIIDIDLKFKSTIEPNGRVYTNEEGDEAIITYNSKTGNMFGTIKTHDHKSYAIEAGHTGHVFKDFDTESFELELPIKIDAPKILGKKKFVDHGQRDDTTHVTYSVMIYYTADFAAVTADIPGFVDQALAESNQGYANSLIPLTITLLCIEAATINDIADTSDFISAFANMKGSTTALRNTADSAYLLAKDFNSCGVGYLATYDK